MLSACHGRPGPDRETVLASFAISANCTSFLICRMRLGGELAQPRTFCRQCLVQRNKPDGENQTVSPSGGAGHEGAALDGEREQEVADAVERDQGVNTATGEGRGPAPI